MTSQHHQSSMLIAAHEPSQGTALADMIHKLRPDAEIFQLRSPDAPVPPSAQASPTLALVVAASAERLRRMSGPLRAKYPAVGMIVIAPQFDDAVIAAAAEARASALIQSPCDTGALFELIQSQERRQPFVGRSSEISTSELLRLHDNARSTGVLYFVSTAGIGRIHLQDGQPIDARCGGQEGASAVIEILSWADAKVTWMAGHSARTRTMLGSFSEILEREVAPPDNLPVMREAPRDVLDKLANLASIDDIVSAFLLRNSEIVIGYSNEHVDEVVMSRALIRLSQVFHDMETIQGQEAGPEIQATMGDHRLVVDRIGPSRFGFQVGVVVNQATPVCKSLRRLLRQMDRSFRRSLSASARRASVSSTRPGAREAANLHRVA